MSTALAFVAVFVLLLFSVYKNVFIVYPLLAGLVIFILLSLKRGFRLKELLKMTFDGGKKALSVIKIFTLIGAIMSVWMAGGTIAFIVYYGTKLIIPSYFILSAFIISSMVSFMLGTSFGTTGTIGIALAVLARSGNVNINMVAGAIIAGAFFGDRCSFMSSSANLVASITETDLYTNMKNMLKTSIIPFILSAGIYLVLSLYNPLVFDSTRMSDEILKVFNINFVVILPAVLILLLAIFKVDVKLSMLLSILAALAAGIFVQHESLLNMLKIALLGYSMEKDSFLKTIIHGGGILSMLKLSLIVFISSAYSGIFEGTDMLKDIETLIGRLSSRYGSFLTTVLTSIITACFGCTQALAIILTQQLVNKQYSNVKPDKYDLAIDIENTAVVVSPLIPWNIAGAVPAAVLAVGPGFILYAVYLYLIPLVNYFSTMKRESKVPLSSQNFS